MGLCTVVLITIALATGCDYATDERAYEGYEQEDFDTALKLYREAQRENPNSPELHYNVGTALYKVEHYETAMEEFRQALVADELRARALFNIGNSHFQRKQFAEAIEAYKQSLEFDHEQPDAAANLELALQMTQQQQQQPDADEEEEAKPKTTELAKMMRRAAGDSLALGKYRATYDLVAEAIEKDSTFYEAHKEFVGRLGEVHPIVSGQ